MMSQEHYNLLSERYGQARLRRRLELEVHEEVPHLSLRHLWFNIKHRYVYYPLALGLWVTGLMGRGRSNFIDYEINEVDVPLKNLPSSLDGMRMLQLSDLHAESLHDEGKALISCLKDIDFDLAVITGDFRFLQAGDYSKAVNKMTPLIEALRCTHGIVGVLGNHDSMAMVPPIEALGVQMLLNESMSIKQGEGVFYIAGVDDPHYFKEADITKAMQDIPSDGTVVLLAHSPEVYEEAETLGVDYYISGHTHGGQVCLPGGFALISNCRAPRRLTSGSWIHGNMLGYTSKGVGGSGLSVRFFCPPEITIHRFISA